MFKSCADIKSQARPINPSVGNFFYVQQKIFGENKVTVYDGVKKSKYDDNDFCQYSFEKRPSAVAHSMNNIFKPELVST